MIIILSHSSTDKTFRLFLQRCFFFAVCKTVNETQMYSLLDSVGEGEGGMIWENGIEICISYKK